MITWKSKICRGMDVVETITYTRQMEKDGKIITASACYVPGGNEQKPRDQWTQEEIDAIGDKLVSQLDEILMNSKPPKIEQS
jgi:hypothetical protein